MGLGIPPLKIRIQLESIPLKSRILVQTRAALAARRCLLAACDAPPGKVPTGLLHRWGCCVSVVLLFGVLLGAPQGSRLLGCSGMWCFRMLCFKTPTHIIFRCGVNSPHLQFLRVNQLLSCSNPTSSNTTSLNSRTVGPALQPTSKPVTWKRGPALGSFWPRNGTLRLKQAAVPQPLALSLFAIEFRRADRALHREAAFGKGDGTVGNPHRAQICQFEFVELIFLLRLDKQLPVERFKATVSQSTVPSPPS